MQRLNTEDEVHETTDSPAKRAMEAKIRTAHADLGAHVAFDLVRDCGGGFHVLEEGDDPKSIVLSDEAVPVDLTDLQARCYEFVELSECGNVFVLFLATNDAGGPCFFVPNKPWIGEDFRRDLAVAAGCSPEKAAEGNMP